MFPYCTKNTPFYYPIDWIFKMGLKFLFFKVVSVGGFPPHVLPLKTLWSSKASLQPV